MTRRVQLIVVALLGASAALGAHSVLGEPSRKPGPPTSVVYAAPSGGMRVNHALPAHAALACERCHTRAQASTRVGDDLLPTEAACTPCHAERIDRTRPDPQCAFCHLGFDAKRRTAIAPVRSAPAQLVFSHAKHAQHDVGCDRCHAGSGTERALPSMAQCLDCHTGTKALPCNGCHVALPSGRLRTSLPEGKLVPRSGFLGMAHDADFIVRHRWLAADEGAACKSCHVEDDCSECHDGHRRPRGIHPNDYLTLHAQDAMRNATRCTSCHTTQSFCLPCHARLGVSSLSAPDLAAPKRLHPPTAVWLRGPNLHAREAERSMSSCVSCHAERDCVVCHGAKGIGGAGHSPHPSGFVGECASLLRHGERACRSCHGDVDALKRRCR